MSFTRKHYIEVARVIHDRSISGLANLDAKESEGYRHALLHVQGDLARMFAADNPRFDAERFNKACEPKGGE